MGKCAIFLIVVVTAEALYAQSLFLDGEYILPTRAAGMSAYVADADYAHAVSLNPAKLGLVRFVHAASDYESFSRDPQEFFLGDTSSHHFDNGRFSAWDASAAFPVGPVGCGISYSSFYLGGWHTTISELGIGTELPYGFLLGATGKYITLVRLAATPGGVLTDPVPPYLQTESKMFTFDVGIGNRTVLADNMFFRAVVSEGATFKNLLTNAGVKWVGTQLSAIPDVQLPGVLTVGVSYLFASNYRVADFELFRLTGAVDYSHVFSGANPPDDIMTHADQYRAGLEASALGILSLRIGYVLKRPGVAGIDDYNRLYIPRAGTGFSYGFSLRFPTKLLLPSLPVTSVELSYAKSPEWSSGMYHDLFGLAVEMQF